LESDGTRAERVGRGGGEGPGRGGKWGGGEKRKKGTQSKSPFN